MAAQGGSALLMAAPLSAAAGLLGGSAISASRIASLLGAARTFATSAASSSSAAGAMARAFTTKGANGVDALMLADVSLLGRRAPLLLGLYNYFERHLPHVGFFEPITGKLAPGTDAKIDRHVDLVYKTFNMQGDPGRMTGLQDVEAARLLAAGKQADLLDKIYGQYAAYKEGHDLVLVEGPGPVMGGTELDAMIASTINAPVLMTMSGSPAATANDYFNTAMVKRQVFADHKVDVLGLVINGLPRSSHALITQQLREKLDRAGLAFAGALPEDPLLSSVRLDEVRTALGADQLYGDRSLTDVEFDDVVVASQRLEELLEMLGERPGGRPLVVTSADRLDIVLGLLASHLSVRGPDVAGILLTQAGTSRGARNYARSAIDSIFAGLGQSSMYKGTLLPVLSVDRPLREALAALGRLDASILPTSGRKITQCKALFDRYIDTNQVVAGLQKSRPTRVTPKMFQHAMKQTCLASPQHIVLPESVDKRILAAAAEVTARGLARVTLLGDPAAVNTEAKKLGLDLSGCTIHNPAASDRMDKYIEMLVEARAKKGMTKEMAADLLNGDINFYGTLMVAAGDADGMVSGAMHTTAATIRPALQLLRTPDASNVSSVFFMCLPDRVLVYGDCAVNVNPSAAELAQIAITSADTAKAFGIDPRVAMLSYSTLGSGAGPDVQKVTEAVKIVKERRPDIMVEGPIQYDAAIDPEVAAVKIKGENKVAGKATVFVFPDLNTGNNTYKAVQQSTGAVAMGPVMQGLLKPVNDLSRGCTVPDIVNTICVTSIQAMQFKVRAKKA
ncbi:hypothetical protein HYH03_007567 [Edaphochlamys debaryana]|uniref:Phosphate acetyltransferase n=1 Tax=Edaphochlamys debaryana TaxID=47281 RepID=A0A835YAY1_9CHLO|nr:hypothetical protein HYH03_007567 [Edaphochlamys debaryana]|eukprot:KAG2494209.1 hypothetical protein HYH03_007567 [Edaphochlamys debaryana]